MIRLILGLVLMGVVTACTEPEMATAVPPTTPALIACNERTVTPTPGSILPPFEPEYACQLENSSASHDFCLVHASPTLTYPCSQTESVKEVVLSDSETARLIQRDYRYSAGCWTAVTTNIRSLRACDKSSGASTILAANIYGPIAPSPDGKWFAFVATEPGKFTEPHIFRVGADEEKLVQLDIRPFPQTQVPGASISQWSADSAWLDVGLWDGSEWYNYRLRTDGSGEFETLP